MLGELPGQSLRIAGAADADHRLAGEAELERIGYRDDLQQAALAELLNAVAHSSFRQANGLADRRVGTPAVGLEFFDDLLRDGVEVCRHWFAHMSMVADSADIGNRNHGFS